MLWWFDNLPLTNNWCLSSFNFLDYHQDMNFHGVLNWITLFYNLWDRVLLHSICWFLSVIWCMWFRISNTRKIQWKLFSAWTTWLQMLWFMLKIVFSICLLWRTLPFSNFVPSLRYGSVFLLFWGRCCMLCNLLGRVVYMCP